MLARAVLFALFASLVSTIHVVAQDAWNPGINMGPVVNSQFTEKASDISVDGLTVFFHHNTPQGDINIFYSEWDGNNMYFTRDEPSGYGGFGMYTATRYTTGDACTAAATVPALVTVQAGSPGQYEQFVVRVVGQALLDQMIDICLGDSPQQIVLGDLLSGNDGYNQDFASGFVWSWHLDEDTVGLADVTIELCDGGPGGVEADLQYWIETVGIFCPWSSQIVAIAADTSLAGDFDIDGDVDVDDATLLQGCFAGSGSPCYDTGAGCCVADMDGDTDIDCVDWDSFVSAWTEPGEPPGFPQCTGAVPAVSQWGALVMTLFLLTAGTIIWIRRCSLTRSGVE